VRQDAFDGHVIHFRECSAEHGGNKKECGNALGIQKFCNKSPPGDFSQSLLPLKNDWRDLNFRKRAANLCQL
jgi:hypothetical protein